VILHHILLFDFKVLRDKFHKLVFPALLYGKKLLLLGRIREVLGKKSLQPMATRAGWTFYKVINNRWS
jgi:hypothetical protein